MRWDLTGIFWDDYVPPKPPAEKVVRTPPERVWERPDYLPHFDLAVAHKPQFMTDAEIMNASRAKERLIWDAEFYPNYALIGFQHEKSKKIIKHVSTPLHPFNDMARLEWILRNFTLVGFNDTYFDIPMAIAALAGFNTEQMMDCVKDLIHGREGERGGMPLRDFYKVHDLKAQFFDHIDLRELTPLGPSLKVCAGRLHTPLMQDLPFVPETWLTDDQITVLDWYWENDLNNTRFLYEKHIKENALPLRELLTAEYKTDVRSKSDPQIAEAVIRSEIKRLTKIKYFEKADVNVMRKFKYRAPDYVKFKTPMMQQTLQFIEGQVFMTALGGGVIEPEGMQDLVITIGDSSYTMGIGGLHSKEKRVAHHSDDDWEITDNDVTSYYPSLILQQGMFPPNIGPVFLKVFKRIYDRRVAAKRDGDKNTSETLKIVLNGTFGKTGERGGHSIVYYPEMMIQVTLSGQLALLLLIEWLELAGIKVISANTDGIMIKCPRHKIELKARIIKQWEELTGLGLESVGYKSVYSRDVNNYIAVYDEPKKGDDGFRYAKAIGAYRKTLDVYPIKWNPTCDVVNEAVITFLATGVSIEETIRACSDVRKFIEVRRVAGGTCKNGEYFGKVIRWYYAQGVTDEIINAKNGHSVPRSKGGKPCMMLPNGIPDDIDFEYYIQRAYDVLDDFKPKQKKGASECTDTEQSSMEQSET